MKFAYSIMLSTYTILIWSLQPKMDLMWFLITAVQVIVVFIIGYAIGKILKKKLDKI